MIKSFQSEFIVFDLLLPQWLDFGSQIMIDSAFSLDVWLMSQPPARDTALISTLILAKRLNGAPRYNMDKTGKLVNSAEMTAIFGSSDRASKSGVDLLSSYTSINSIDDRLSILKELYATYVSQVTSNMIATQLSQHIYADVTPVEGESYLTLGYADVLAPFSLLATPTFTFGFKFNSEELSDKELFLLSNTIKGGNLQYLPHT